MLETFCKSVSLNQQSMTNYSSTWQMSSVDDLLFSLIMLINKVTCAKYSHCLSHCFDEWQAFSHHWRICGRDWRGSGHRERFRARLLVPSSRRLNTADRSSSSRSSYDEAGLLSQDQQAMRPAPLPPPGGLRGCDMFSLLIFLFWALISYSLITKLRTQ